MQEKQQGFSLIEVIIASFVLITGITASLAIFGPAIEYTGAARDRAIASALAQEGSEFVKNYRDNNMLSGQDFDDNIASGSKICIDRTGIQSCNGTGTLKKNGVWYEYSGSISTKFRRKVYMSGSGDNLIATSFVVWGTDTFPAAGQTSLCKPSKKCTFTHILLKDWY